MRVGVLAACALLATGASAAHADDVQKAKERAQACSAQASEKQMSQERQRAFLKACMASEGPVVAPSEPVRAKDREKDCATLAASKAMTGPDRDAFMKSCVAASGS